MNPINNQLHNNANDVNTTEESVLPLMDACKNLESLPQQAITDRNIFAISDLTLNDLNDFPVELHKQHLQNIPSQLVEPLLRKWNRTTLKNRIEELKEIISSKAEFSNIKQETESIYNVATYLSDIKNTNKLTSIGSTKILYDALKKMQLSSEAEELLNISLVAATESNINQSISTSTQKTPDKTNKSTNFRSEDKFKNSCYLPRSNNKQINNNPKLETTIASEDKLTNPFKTKDLPPKDSEAYAKITMYLSIDMPLGGDWRSLMGRYGMSAGDVNIIESQARWQDKFPGEIALEEISKMASIPNKALSLYNTLRDMERDDIADILYDWAIFATD